jgi:serine/threonine protein kinase
MYSIYAIDSVVSLNSCPIVYGVMSYNQLITDYKQSSESEAHSWAVEISDALNYLHENFSFRYKTKQHIVH